MNTPPSDALTRHTLVLRLRDRAGAMELIAATFAHRGISLGWTLGSDGSDTPDGYATVIVHFAASPARTLAVRRALERLSPVASVTEADNHAVVQKTALVRVEWGTPPPPTSSALWVHTVREGAPPDTQTGESGDGSVYLLGGTPEAVEAALQSLRETNALQAVTQTVLAL